jgi:mRNA-degrading endonuclease toxin of MazEF toxin-antitoxin module
MADRRDVFRLKRRLGFGAKGEAEAVIVIQATPLNAVLPTLVVVPLDPAIGAYGSHAAALRVSRQEAGSNVDQMAVPWRLRALAADALAPGPTGRLTPATLANLDRLIALVLGLP